MIRPEEVFEYDGHMIDETKMLKEPRPLPEVMRELNYKLDEIDRKYRERQTA